MNQDLKSRIPVAILYVLIIAAATFGGQVSSSVLLSSFAALCIIEYLGIGYSKSAIYHSVVILFALFAFAVVSIYQVPPSYVQYATILSCIFFIINGSFLLIQKRCLLPDLPPFISTAAYIIFPLPSLLSLTH